MKYKLINLNTNEEHICSKVEIDGFDYYVTEYNVKKEGQYCVGSDGVMFKDENHFPISIGQRMIIATNNPNIDIPKVVDEVEKLAKEYCQYWEYKRILGSGSNGLAHDAFVSGYNESQKTHQHSDVDMIEFKEWCNKIALGSGLENKSTKELLQIWIEQKPKTLYYVTKN